MVLKISIHKGDSALSALQDAGGGLAAKSVPLFLFLHNQRHDYDKGSTLNSRDMSASIWSDEN